MLASLKKLGYPVPAYPSIGNEPVRIVFKDKRWRKDDEYKIDEIKKLGKVNDVAAMFDDSKKILDAARREFPSISRVAVMIYPDMKEKDFECLPRSQKKITEYMKGTSIRGGVECIKDFSRSKVMPGCKIVVNNKVIT
jgi:hypothetical protein